MGRYKKYLAIFLMFSIHMMPFNAFAAPKPLPNRTGDWEVHEVKKVTLDDVTHATDSAVFSDIIELTMRQKNTVNGTSQVLESVIQKTVDKEERKRLGHAMYERVKKSKGQGGVAGILGAAAMATLIESVGWVMEEGTYVKRIQINPDPSPSLPPDTDDYIYCPLGRSSCEFTLRDRLNVQINKYLEENRAYAESVDFLSISGSKQLVKVTFKFVILGSGSVESRTRIITVDGHGIYLHNNDPQDPDPNTYTIPLTDELVGDLMFGDYTDPVDQAYNKKDNKWTAPRESHSKQRDPEVGNDPANRANYDAENNPDKRLIDDGTKPKPTNPDTTNPTNPDGSPNPDYDPNTRPQAVQLPAFCSWATIVCDWIGWTQEELEQDTEIEIEDDQTEAVDTDIAFASGCPVFPIQAQWHGFTLDFTIDLTNMCDAFSTIVKPIVISMATFSSIYILAGVRNDE